MSKFEEFFDDFLGKAKAVADTAGKKTSDMVDIGKVRYQIKQTQWDIEKTYSKLGALVYESKKGNENFDEVIALAVSEIDLLNERMEELEQRLRIHKNISKCPGCGKENDIESAFCSGCGTELEVYAHAPEEIEVEFEVKVEAAGTPEAEPEVKAEATGTPETEPEANSYENPTE